MTRPLTDREARIIRETPELGWPDDAWTEATHRVGQVPDRLIARLAARMDSESATAVAEARQREAETLARIDAQFERTRGRFRDQLPTWEFLGGFLGLCLIAAAVFTLGTAGAAFLG